MSFCDYTRFECSFVFDTRFECTFVITLVSSVVLFLTLVSSVLLGGYSAAKKMREQKNKQSEKLYDVSFSLVSSVVH